MKTIFIIAGLAAGIAASVSPTIALAQAPTPVSGAEAGHLTASGTAAIRNVSAGRRHYEYTADFCKVIAQGSQTLAELRAASDQAYAASYVNGRRDTTQQGYSQSFDKLANELQTALDEWFWYYSYERCHPPSNPAGAVYETVPWTALSLGTYLIGINRAKEEMVETLRTTHETTNVFQPVGDPPGFGFQATYLFAPWHNALRLGPYASVDVLHQAVNQNFAGGQFLGTTTHWLVTAGAKFGGVVTPDLFLYGLAGASWLNRDLNVNFATAASSNVMTPGFTLGIGGEWHPPSWQLAGHAVTLFAQYQHTWWDTANFYAPASSPAYDYAFKREDDTFKFGVNFYFGAAPSPAPSPSYPVKAPVAK